MLKFIKKAASQVRESFKIPVDPQVLIAEIHHAFDTEAERLLEETKVILADKSKIDKGERLANIGFTSAKLAVERTQYIAKKQKNEALASNVEHTQRYYPNHKFINQESVQRICKKYGLVFGDISYYIGDVPDKNLAEMEKFSLRAEDYTKYDCSSFVWDNRKVHGYYLPTRWGSTFVHVSDESIKTVSIKPTYMICASPSDFDMANLRVEDGYKLALNLPDPIVLQPVKGGYIVVTKWGLEASDPSLVNEIQN